MKVLFMGTPSFGAEVLDALNNCTSHTLVGAVIQPDRAIKRGKIEKSAVKLYCENNGIPFFQPERIRDHTDELKAFGADIAVTAAYGQLLTQNVLDAFPMGVINVHASLLPKYRGASPIYSAILNGEKITGVTIMRTELGLDSGDILSAVKTEIGENDTADSLTKRLAALGSELLINTLDNFGSVVAVKQDESLATKCKTVKKSETYIDFNKPSDEVCRQIRALSSNPCAKTVIDGEVYKVYFAKPIQTDGVYVPGTVIAADGSITVACANDAIEITSIQAPGKRRMDTADFLRGNKIKIGAVCAKP